MSRGQGRVFRPVVRGQHTKVWWLDYSVRGERHRESSGTTSKREAQRLLRKRLGDREDGKLIGNPGKVTLADLKAGLKRHYTRENLRSWENFGLYCFKHLERLLGATAPVSDMTTARLRWYLDTRLGEGAARASVRSEIGLLNAAFTVAVVEDQILAARPTFLLPTVRNARAGFFEPGDVAALMAELPTPLHRHIVQFAYYTGWRREEILGLAWAQVAWESKVLRIDPPTDAKRTKGEDARVIPFADTPLEVLLKERWEHRDGPFVFQKGGARLHSFYKVWRAACKRAGLAGRTLHDFRRTAARELVNAGVPEKVVRQIVGWKSARMLDRYFIINEAVVAQAVAKRFGTGKQAANNGGAPQQAPV